MHATTMLERGLVLCCGLAALIAAHLLTAAPAHADEAVAASCVLATHDGVEAGVALTAASFVCEALRAEGVEVDAAAVASEGAVGDGFRVELGRLDSLVVLRVSEVRGGRVVASRSAQIADLDEIVVAAPRMARALAHGAAFEATASVDTLVAQETREAQQKWGEFLWGLGLHGVYVPGVPTVAPGAAVGVAFETPSFAVVGNARLGGMDQRDLDVFFWAVELGARYLVGEGNTAFFAGGGMGWTGLAIERWDWGDDPHTIANVGIGGEGHGFAAYAEVGVEFLRFYGMRLIVDLRVELPAYTLQDWREWHDDKTQTWGSDTREYYVVPLGLGVSYLW